MVLFMTFLLNFCLPDFICIHKLHSHERTHITDEPGIFLDMVPGDGLSYTTVMKWKHRIEREGLSRSEESVVLGCPSLCFTQVNHTFIIIPNPRL